MDRRLAQGGRAREELGLTGGCDLGERQRWRQRVSRHMVDRIGDDAVDAPRGQVRDAFRLVRRVAEHAVTCGSHSSHDVGIELLVIDVERDAFEPRETREPIGRQLVDEQRAGK